MILICRGFHRVADFAEASALYSRMRDESGEGASTFPEGWIWDCGTQLGRVSYNGRVWAPKTWRSDDVPLYDPYPPKRAHADRAHVDE